MKLPQSKYYENKTLHTLAANIGLPAHLVDLRNEIIHGDCGYAGGCTIAEAVETCYTWVKVCYDFIFKNVSSKHLYLMGSCQFE